jgi:hypothetical protein
MTSVDYVFVFGLVWGGAIGVVVGALLVAACRWGRDRGDRR